MTTFLVLSLSTSSEKISDKGNNDVGLLLAWNYESQILQKENKFRSNSRKFLVPVPLPKLI